MDDFDSKPFFSSVSNLAPSPTCEHGIEQRWCNGLAKDGRLCADKQVEIDLNLPKNSFNVLANQDAKRSALRGGPCVALTQPLSRALVKYDVPETGWLDTAPAIAPQSPFNWRGLLATLCKYWLIRQAHEQYFQTYFGRPR